MASQKSANKKPARLSPTKSHNQRIKQREKLNAELDAAFSRLKIGPTSYNQILFQELIEEKRRNLSDAELAADLVGGVIKYLVEHELVDTTDRKFAPEIICPSHNLWQLGIELPEFIDALSQIELDPLGYTEALYNYRETFTGKNVNKNYTVQELIDGLAKVFAEYGRQ